MLKYRPEIDGLSAIAVSLAVIFHAALAALLPTRSLTHASANRETQ